MDCPRIRNNNSIESQPKVVIVVVVVIVFVVAIGVGHKNLTLKLGKIGSLIRDILQLLFSIVLSVVVVVDPETKL